MGDRSVKSEARQVFSALPSSIDHDRVRVLLFIRFYFRLKIRYTFEWTMWNQKNNGFSKLRRSQSYIKTREIEFDAPASWNRGRNGRGGGVAYWITSSKLCRFRSIQLQDSENNWKWNTSRWSNAHIQRISVRQQIPDRATYRERNNNNNIYIYIWYDQRDNCILFCCIVYSAIITFIVRWL